MATMKEVYQRVFRLYQEEHGDTPASARDVATWAMNKKLVHPRPVDPVARIAEDMADAFREEYRTDLKTGRRYRANLAVRGMRNGKQTTIWGDIEKQPRAFVLAAAQQRREQILGECWQLKQDVSVFNSLNPDLEPIQVPMDFTYDIEEREELEKIGEQQAG